MHPTFVQVICSCADALAAIAISSALLIAVFDASNKAEIPPAVPFLAALGIILFVAERILRYFVAWH